jgi:hypothetical protein
MNEEQKKRVAIFRFGVISDFLSPTRLGCGERARLLAQKCARQWQIPFSHLYKSIHDLTIVRLSSLSSIIDSSTHAAIIFSLARGMLSIKVCIGVFP